MITTGRTLDDNGRPVPGTGFELAPDGERHSFTIEGEDLCYMLVDIRSPGRLRYVLPTLGGLAHDADRNADSPLQQAMIAQRLAGNTVFTEIDETIAKPLRAGLAPLARLHGYRGAYAKYTQDAFWERHVEQPYL